MHLTLKLLPWPILFPFHHVWLSIDLKSYLQDGKSKADRKTEQLWALGFFPRPIVLQLFKG